MWNEMIIFILRKMRSDQFVCKKLKKMRFELSSGRAGSVSSKMLQSEQMQRNQEKAT